MQRFNGDIEDSSSERDSMVAYSEDLLREMYGFALSNSTLSPLQRDQIALLARKDDAYAVAVVTSMSTFMGVYQDAIAGKGTVLSSNYEPESYMFALAINPYLARNPHANIASLVGALPAYFYVRDIELQRLATSVEPARTYIPIPFSVHVQGISAEAAYILRHSKDPDDLNQFSDHQIELLSVAEVLKDAFNQSVHGKAPLAPVAMSPRYRKLSYVTAIQFADEGSPRSMPARLDERIKRYVTRK